MSLPHGLLGLLNYQESTGYELTKIFEDSLNNFWRAQSSQIYRELDRMEGKGWVTSRNVPQQGRPNKRLYAITAEGRTALQEWLLGPLSFERPHMALLIRIFFGAGAPEATLALLRACRDMCRQAVEKYSAQIEETIGKYSASVPGGEAQRPYWEMTLRYGIAQARMMANWAQDCMNTLEQEQESRQKSEAVTGTKTETKETPRGN